MSLTPTAAAAPLHNAAKSNPLAADPERTNALMRYAVKEEAAPLLPLPCFGNSGTTPFNGSATAASLASSSCADVDSMDFRHSVLSAVTKVIHSNGGRSAGSPPSNWAGIAKPSSEATLAASSLPDWFPQEIRDPSFPQQGLIDIIAALVELHKTTASPSAPVDGFRSTANVCPTSATVPVHTFPEPPNTSKPHGSSMSPRGRNSPTSFRFPTPYSTLAQLQLPSTGIIALHTDEPISCINVEPPSVRVYNYDPSMHDDSLVFFNPSTSSVVIRRPDAPQLSTTGIASEAAPDFVVDGPDDNADLQVHHKANIAEDDEGNPDSVNGLTFYKRLGSGATSTVWLAVDDDAGEERAVKVIDRQHAVRIHTDGDEDRDGLLTEVAVMKKLRHPHIASMYDCIDDPAANHIYLVMQFVHGGAVASLLPDGGCPIREPKEVALYALQIGSALRYCHRHHVVHGDLKPDNILVERDKDGQHLHAYLTDFGASLFRGSANFQAQAVINQLAAGGDEDDMGNVSLSRAPRVVGGTPALLAPEVFRGHPRTPASDMWALGCTLFALLFGKLPFSGDSYNELRDSILNDEVEFPPEALRGVLRKFRPIIERLLEKRPKRRMTAWEVSHSPVLQQLAGISTQNLSEPTLDHSLAASWIEAIDTEDIKDALTPCRKFGMCATMLPPKKTTSVRAGA